MVTKQQQLEWLAKNWSEWPGFREIPLHMSTKILGHIYYGIWNSFEITRQEWQRERDKMQKQIAQPAQPAPDNSWHERGELPPAGCECEVKTKTFNDWVRCFIVGKSSRGDTVIECDDCAFIIDSSYEFRPLRTEREKAIDEMLSVYAGKDDGKPIHPRCKLLAEMLYDAGYRKVGA